ncbi:MAG: hypothetical protein P0Y60_02040 [Candidatus Microbacterium colombiense]|nr:MAG: hypothetical protein P0Y60_02040 [Microbacterium sp.]
MDDATLKDSPADLPSGDEQDPEIRLLPEASDVGLLVDAASPPRRDDQLVLSDTNPCESKTHPTPRADRHQHDHHADDESGNLIARRHQRDQRR